MWYLYFNMQWVDQAALGVPDQVPTSVIWVFIEQLSVIVISFLC